MTEPFVSIITPVYNGQEYFAKCIESVLSQTYKNWEYHIVNNCSTDDSSMIALGYAKKEARVRVHNNEKLLPMVENFNRSLAYVSPESKYCKIVHADDLLFPSCIEEMVSLAEKHHSLGIVGSYVLEGARTKGDGLPYPRSVFSGREIGQMSLLGKSPASGGFYVFGSPTSLLIRSDLIKSRTPFYRDKYQQVVDQEVCYYLLQKADFGFVYQLLTYSRLHEKSTTSSFQLFNRLILEELMLLLEYGPIYLSQDEYQLRLQQRMTQYYRYMADYALERRDRLLWEFHKEGLAKLNIPLSRAKLLNAISRKFARSIIGAISHPGKIADSLVGKRTTRIRLDQ